MTIDTIGAAPVPRAQERHAGATGVVDTTSASTTGAARAGAHGAVSTTAAPGQADAPSLAQLHDAVSALNKSPQARNQGLEFSVDSDSKRTVVKVIDQSTKEVLRQIPTPEALEIAKALEARSTKGVLIQQTA